MKWIENIILIVIGIIVLVVWFITATAIVKAAWSYLTTGAI